MVMFDIAEGLPQGKALDLSQAGPIEGFDAKLKGTNYYADIKGADVVIVTAGVPRKPGMSRDDLLGINLKVMAAVGEGIKANAPDAFVVCITNPLDAMVWALRQFSGLPHNKVVGMAGVLDSARFRHFLAEEMNVSRGRCLAPSCWAAMATPWCRCRASPPWPAFRCPSWSRWAGSSRTVSTRSSSAPAMAAPRSSACSRPARPFTRRPPPASPWRKAISRTRSACCPARPMSNGAYGIKDLYVGVPAVIGEKGVERIVELELTAEEKAALAKSADSVKGLIDACKKLEPKLA